VWQRTWCFDFSDFVGFGVVAMSASVCHSCIFDHDKIGDE
jgi:hypothetical protein